LWRLAAQSGIHGWGLFARKAMKADSMVIEYRGDVLRRTAADAREKRYQAAGKDCYLFTVQDDFVIDATMRGGIGRFTVGTRFLPRLILVKGGSIHYTPC
jgi:SET domain-containing protein